MRFNLLLGRESREPVVDFDAADWPVGDDLGSSLGGMSHAGASSCGTSLAGRSLRPLHLGTGRLGGGADDDGGSGSERRSGSDDRGSRASGSTDRCWPFPSASGCRVHFPAAPFQLARGKSSPFMKRAGARISPLPGFLFMFRYQAAAMLMLRAAMQPRPSLTMSSGRNSTESDHVLGSRAAEEGPSLRKVWPRVSLRFASFCA